MALPAGWVPYVTSVRRWRFLSERRFARWNEPGAAAAMRSLRLSTDSAPLPATLPGRAKLLSADVLALEEVRGAGVAELRTYGLSVGEAEALINRLETDQELQVPRTFQTGPQAGQAYEEDSVTLRASAEATSSGDGDSYELGDRGTLRLALDVTAISGTNPNLHVQVQTRATSDDTWRTLEAFPRVSAIGTTYISVVGCDRYVRLQHALSGTSPRATFSVTGNGI